MMRLIFRHMTGTRATQLDIVPMAVHRELLLGRATTAAVRFDPWEDREVGRYHARIAVHENGTGFVISDLSSANGTLVNGDLLAAPRELKPGDVIQLGIGGPQVEFLVEDPAFSPAEKRCDP